MFAAALALVTFAAAPVPKGAEKGPLAALQGEWKVVKLGRDGTVKKLDARYPRQVVFTENEVSIRAGTLYQTGTLTITALKDSVRIDLRVCDHDFDEDEDDLPAISRLRCVEYKGLYVRDGNKLTMYLVTGKTHPTSIPREDSVDDGAVLLVLERVKK